MWSSGFGGRSITTVNTICRILDEREMVEFDVKRYCKWRISVGNSLKHSMDTRGNSLLSMYMPFLFFLIRSFSRPFTPAAIEISSSEDRTWLLGRCLWWLIEQLAALDIGPLVSVEV